MSAFSRPNLLDYATLTLLGSIWGASFLFIDIALRSFSALSVTTIRIAVAALFLVAIIVARKTSLPTQPRIWLEICIVGLINLALPFFLISWGQQFISPSRAAILMATAPFFVVIFSYLIAKIETVTAKRLTGLTIGFAAVPVLVGFGETPGEGVIGHFAVLFAAALYALSGILITRFAKVDPFAVGAILFLTTSAYMIPLALILSTPLVGVVQNTSVLAVLFLGIVSTAFAFHLRIRIIHRTGPVFLSQVGYQIPMFGVLWSWVGLSEAPSAIALLALVMLVIGMRLSRA